MKRGTVFYRIEKKDPKNKIICYYLENDRKEICERHLKVLNLHAYDGHWEYTHVHNVDELKPCALCGEDLPTVDIITVKQATYHQNCAKSIVDRYKSYLKDNVDDDEVNTDLDDESE